LAVDEEESSEQMAPGATFTVAAVMKEMWWGVARPAYHNKRETTDGLTT